ncbi:patatin-like serine [Stagonosporopsis vannaccii]|nr:patatin-like serine [Stagonosporopsis vannaccii]
MDRSSRPLRLLSIDGGGGLRGYSALLILERLFSTISDEEKALGLRAPYDNDSLRPCEYFDLIGGSGVGGLIGLLLGRLRLDIETCIAAYADILSDVDEHDTPPDQCDLPAISAPRFSGTLLENAVKRKLRDLGYSEDEPMWDDSLFEEDPIARVPVDWEPDANSIWRQDFHNPLPQIDRPVRGASDSPDSPRIIRISRQNTVHRRDDRRGCRAFVLTGLTAVAGLPQSLSTYNSGDRRTRIWEAVRATCATPGFFDEFSFGEPLVTYSESLGIGPGYFAGLSNPTAETDHAAKSLWEQRSLGIVVSIGMGLSTMPDPGRPWLQIPLGKINTHGVAAICTKQATAVTLVESEMTNMYSNTEVQYFRYDIYHKIPDITVEQWLKEEGTASLMEQYIRDPKQSRSIHQCAETVIGLTTDPVTIEIPADSFIPTMNGKRTGVVVRETVELSKLDLDTTVAQSRAVCLQRPGVSSDDLGEEHLILPLPSQKNKTVAQVLSCIGAQEICFKALCDQIIPGWYRVVFVVCFWETESTKPEDLIFSAGNLRNVSHFRHRKLDVKIVPDVVPILLDGRMSRVRLGKDDYEANFGRGWAEITLQENVHVGSGGQLGLIVNAIFKKGVSIGGWSFGGVRLVPANPPA